MSRNTSPCTLTPEEAGEFLGIDAQTLRLCLRAGYYGDIGHAVKTDPRNECFTYEISKHKVFDHLGLDVTVETQTALQMVRDGNPPYKQERKCKCG